MMRPGGLSNSILNTMKVLPGTRLRARWSLRAMSAGLLVAFAVVATAQTITVGTADPARYLNDVKALTVSAMEGRGDDTKGIALATSLLEARYKSLALLPAGTEGFRQPFS